jgi:hypothetical protein
MNRTGSLERRTFGEERSRDPLQLGDAELAQRRAAAEAAAAERRAAGSALAEQEAAARERLQRLDEHIDSLLSHDPQEFVIRFLQTGGQ